MSESANVFDYLFRPELFSQIFDGEDVVSFLDRTVKETAFYQKIIDYCSSVLAAALVLWGLFYFVKALWDLTRGQESWDEFFVFIVRKSIPVILLLLFVLPVNLGSFSTGGQPFALYVFDEGAKGAFKEIPQMFFGNSPIEAMPVVLVKNFASDAWERIQRIVNEETLEVYDTTPTEAYITNTEAKFDFHSSHIGKFIFELSQLFLRVMFKFGAFILVLGVQFVYLAQLVVIKLKFIFFAPLFYLSAIFLLIDKYRDIFYDNFKTLFAWMLQPTFLILATYAGLLVGIYVMLLFVEDSFITNMFNMFFTIGYADTPQEGVPFISARWWANFIKNVFIMLIYFIAFLLFAGMFLKLAWSVPKMIVDNVMSGLSRVVSSAFRSLD